MIGSKIDSNYSTASFRSGHERDYWRLNLPLGSTSDCAPAIQFVWKKCPKIRIYIDSWAVLNEIEGLSETWKKNKIKKLKVEKWEVWGKGT